MAGAATSGVDGTCARGSPSASASFTAVDDVDLDDAAAGRSSPCSARPAAARRRRCGWSPGSSSRPAAGSCSATRTSPTPSRTGGRSTRCSRATRCSRTWTSSRTSRSACAGAGPRTCGPRSARRWSWSSSAHLARRKPAQLSGGQQQRVALARAIVNRPEVLLLDEPLGALDLKLRRQMQLELKRIQTEVGITFVHVTHDQEEAMTMADTIAVMNAGRIEQLGDADRALRVAGDRVRRELPRPVQPAAGRGRRPRRRRRCWSTSTAAGSRCRPTGAGRPAGDVLVGVRPEKMQLRARAAPRRPG